MLYFSFPGNFFMTLDRRFNVRVIENVLKYPVTSFQNLNQAQKSIKWKKKKKILVRISVKWNTLRRRLPLTSSFWKTRKLLKHSFLQLLTSKSSTKDLHRLVKISKEFKNEQLSFSITTYNLAHFATILETYRSTLIY